MQILKNFIKYCWLQAWLPIKRKTKKQSWWQDWTHGTRLWLPDYVWDVNSSLLTLHYEVCILYGHAHTNYSPFVTVGWTILTNDTWKFTSNMEKTLRKWFKCHITVGQITRLLKRGQMYSCLVECAETRDRMTCKRAIFYTLITLVGSVQICMY